ncbi:hypothetical protein D3870_08230 [Noviherbaspirillum cavernae]|uniref:Uncharacterized protein n=1 Tax=Noviherbaspirillum cavernae TaxID=2320862 RepID=A0A418X652_9BURK|nr:hypothetical protein [Noviherbaspirillum cavernae]RJG07925.1 hypothetical protein D3870_08230 [Noviherbaspirillum cavernae]
MRSEYIGEYEIEYAGIQLPESEHWGAFVAIYGPSPNPMHRNSVFPEQRVNVDVVFSSEVEAEAEAHRIAISMVEQSHYHPDGGLGTHG